MIGSYVVSIVPRFMAVATPGTHFYRRAHFFCEPQGLSPNGFQMKRRSAPWLVFLLDFHHHKSLIVIRASLAQVCHVLKNVIDEIVRWEMNPLARNRIEPIRPQ